MRIRAKELPRTETTEREATKTPDCLTKRGNSSSKPGCLEYHTVRGSSIQILKPSPPSSHASKGIVSLRIRFSSFGPYTRAVIERMGLAKVKLQSFTMI